MSNTSNNAIDTLTRRLAALPGYGPRSAKRAALHLLQNKPDQLKPLLHALEEADRSVVQCTNCGNLDSRNPCGICTDPKREDTVLCIVTSVADIWAIERTSSFSGKYHVLGGILSAIDGIGPGDLNLGDLKARASDLGQGGEIVMALPASVDGQATMHYINDLLSNTGVKVTGLARGIPMGGELDYLDDGTIITALKSRS